MAAMSPLLACARPVDTNGGGGGGAAEAGGAGGAAGAAGMGGAAGGMGGSAGAAGMGGAAGATGMGGAAGATGKDAGATLPLPGREVLLFTGDNGGGPTSDLNVTAVRDTYQAAQITAEISTTLPADFSTRFGVLWLMNPLSQVDQTVKDAAKALVAIGGRVVLVMEHCKDGCYGDAQDDNAFLSYIGSTVRLSGMGGAPLSATTLVLMSVPPITNGVSQLVVYYTGSVTGGVALGSMSGGDAVIAYQSVGLGDVVAVADSSMFGYVIASGDNRRFIANLGVPLR
jgi:hypothetical protein